MQKYLWLDMEMSGLEVDSCRILEVAAIITSADLKEEFGQFEVIVKQDQAVLDRMDEWCQKTHGESGLSERVKSGVPESEAEQSFLKFLDAHFQKDDRIILAGNSIGQDRKFIDYYWQELANRLHYRMLDVSAFKIVFQNLFQEEFQKSGKHRALEDIRESIKELQHYLSFISYSK